MSTPVTIKELFFLLGEEIHKGNKDKVVYLGGRHRLNEGEVSFKTGKELQGYAMFKDSSEEELDNFILID